MVAIEKNGTIQTFSRLPNRWEDEKGVHMNLGFAQIKKTMVFMT